VSTDLQAQLERYIAAVAEEQDHISLNDVHELLPRVRTVPTSPVGHRYRIRRGVWVAVSTAVMVLVLLGGLTWLTGRDGTVEPATPTTTVAPTITTIAPPDVTTSTLIPAPAPETLSRSQMEHQVEFLDAFQELGLLRGGGCSGASAGPFRCEVQIESPTMGGPATKTFTVGDIDDDLTWGSKYGETVREDAETGLAALYTWALETYPAETAARCEVEFTGDANHLAWSPGYIANFPCGEHLAGLISEFNPSERPEPPAETEQPDPNAGLWSQLEPITPEGAPPFWALTDVADTPVGLIAVGVDGLWISQDGIEWRPHAREQVEFRPDSFFGKIAASELGIVVTVPELANQAQSWFSPDGLRWISIEALRTQAAVSTINLTASDHHFVIINDQHRLVSSTDGIEWTTVEGAVDPGLSLFTPRSGHESVEATPYGFFVSGGRGTWVSRDGVLWTTVSIGSGDQSLLHVAGYEDDLVAVTADGRIWHSTNGVSWVSVHDIEHDTESTWLGCTRVAGAHIGFLIVTTTTDGFEPGEVRAWFSQDGEDWSRVPVNDRVGPREEGQLCTNALIPWEDGFLAVADTQSQSQASQDMTWIYSP